MALQDNSSATTCSPQQVAAAFVNQYYQTLRNSPEQVHRFYSDSSTLGREDSNGDMTSVTTLHGINAQIMSTDYTGYVIELQTVDTQASHVGGVLILVTGSFTTPDAKKKFTQSFFLAPQGHGAYFVLNDMFRFVSEMPSAVTDEALPNNDNESTQKVNLPAESETASTHEGVVPDLPSAASLTVNHVANGVALVKNDNGVEACLNTVKVATTPDPAVKAVPTPAAVEKAVPAPAAVEKAAPAPAAVEKAASGAPAPAMKVATTSVEKAAPAPAPASTEKGAPPADEAAPAPVKGVSKKSYASIVKEISTLPAPTPAPTVKSKPSPRPKAAQNAEKSATSPPKPAQAVNSAPAGNKNIPKSKQPDEPGYSIFVKNLPYNATVEMVEQEFRKFGAIKPGGIQVRNRQIDRFCFGFVEFESQQSMEDALAAHTVYFGPREACIEEKRTTTRVVNGVITRGDDNGNGGGNRFQSGRGGYQGENFRGRGEGYGNNGNYYRDGDNMRNGYRNDSGRGQGPRGNNNGYYYQNKNSYHQNGNGYHQNGYAQSANQQQRRPSQNSNGRVERANVPPTKQTPVAA